MAISIKDTKATDCGVVYDLPLNAQVNIEKTEAVRVQTVLKVRDNNDQFREKLLDYLNEGTPVEVIDQFVTSIQKLSSKDKESIELATYRSGIDKFLNSTTANVINFSSAVLGILSSLAG